MNAWRTAAYFAAYGVSRIVPRSVGTRIADTASFLAHMLKKHERACVENNLSALLRQPAASPAIRQSARNIYRNFGRTCVDLLYETQSTRIPMLFDLQWVDRHILDDALVAKRGVILVGVHSGSWELGAMALAGHGYPLTLLAPHAPAPGVSFLYKKQRRRAGLNVIDASRDLIKCVRVLKAGGILGVMADRAAGTVRHTSTFFGRPARLPEGAARLAALGGSAVVGATLRRGPDGSLILKMWSGANPDASPAADRSGDLQARITRLAESMIAEAPEEWFCFEDPWKTSV